MHVPEEQVVGPTHPCPPHWPYNGEPLDIGVVEVVVVVRVLEVVPVGFEPPRAEFITSSKTGKIREAIIASPAAFGWTPSRRSDVGNPVLQSAMEIGELEVD